MAYQVMLYTAGRSVMSVCTLYKPDGTPLAVVAGAAAALVGGARMAYVRERVPLDAPRMPADVLVYDPDAEHGWRHVGREHWLDDRVQMEWFPGVTLCRQCGEPLLYTGGDDLGLATWECLPCARRPRAVGLVAPLSLAGMSNEELERVSKGDPLVQVLRDRRKGDEPAAAGPAVAPLALSFGEVAAFRQALQERIATVMGVTCPECDATEVTKRPDGSYMCDECAMIFEL